MNVAFVNQEGHYLDRCPVTSGVVEGIAAVPVHDRIGRVGQGEGVSVELTEGLDVGVLCSGDERVEPPAAISGAMSSGG